MIRLRSDLRSILSAALRACDPGTLLSRALAAHPIPRQRRVKVVAAGKAAARMAEVFATLCDGQVEDVAVARGAHPLPDAASVAAGERALRLARAARQTDALFVLLLSGGASAMMAAPAEGISLEEKIALTQTLLASGRPIADINAVRKHVSRIKGGQLGAAAGRSMTFALSDVHAPVEDDPAVIGSGPTVADPSTFADALGALAAGAGGPADPALDVPAAVRRHLERGIRGEVPETPKPGHAALANAEWRLTGSRRDAMAGASAEAARLGYFTLRLERPTLGDACHAARDFAASAVGAVAAAGVRARANRLLCVVASGETTVTLDPAASGRGGRNQEFALAAAIALGEGGAAPRSRGWGAFALASAGTDGVDGPTDAAGAIGDSTTLARARDMGLDPLAALQAHDSHTFFDRLGDLLRPGPTGTNVGDLQIFLARLSP